MAETRDLRMLLARVHVRVGVAVPMLLEDEAISGSTPSLLLGGGVSNAYERIEGGGSECGVGGVGRSGKMASEERKYFVSLHGEKMTARRQGAEGSDVRSGDEASGA